MDGVANRLAIIGFRTTRRAEECWRVERLGTPIFEPTGNALEHGAGSPISGWVARLRSNPYPEPYRIRRASESR